MKRKKGIENKEKLFFVFSNNLIQSKLKKKRIRLIK